MSTRVAAAVVVLVLSSACEPDTAERFERIVDRGQPTACLPIDVSPPFLEFGEVQSGTLSRRAFTVFNPSRTTIEVALEQPRPPFGVLAPETLLVGFGQRSVEVTFQPPDARRHQAEVRLTSPGCASQTVALSGGGAGGIIVTPSRIDFGNVDAGVTERALLTLHNTSDAPRTVVIESSSDVFRITPESLTIAPAALAQVEVAATPTSVGRFVAQAVITSGQRLEGVAFFEMSSGAARLRVESNELRVPVLPVMTGQIGATRRRLRVFNDGDSDLFVGSRVTPSTGLTVRQPPTILPRQSALLELQFFPNVPGPRQWTVELSDGARLQLVQVFADAVIVPACQATVTVDRGYLQPGPTYPRVERINFTNRSTTWCLVDDLRFDRPEWLVGDVQVVLQPGETAGRDLTFTAPGNGTFRFLTVGHPQGNAEIPVNAWE